MPRGYKLTAEQAEKILAAPVYYALRGHAQITFPHTSRSAPSPTVLFTWSSGGLKGVRESFKPLVMDGEQYRLAVLPVLENESYHPGKPINAACSENQIKEAIGNVGKALRASFEAAGY